MVKDCICRVMFTVGGLRLLIKITVALANSLSAQVDLREFIELLH